MIFQSLINPKGEISPLMSPRNDHVLTQITFDKTSALQFSTGFGLMAALTGSIQVNLNSNNLTIDETSFLVTNLGSEIHAVVTRPTILLVIAFQPQLSLLLSGKMFVSKNPGEVARESFSLVEYVHYRQATINVHIQLLLSLGNSCASFHALKADMVIRSLMDDLIQENFAAIQISDKLDVIKTSTKTDIYQRLALSKKWMEDNFHQSVNLEAISKIAGIHPHHFLRLFKKAFESTPHQYLTSLRVKRAAELLKKSDLTVTEVCEACGFESIASFSHLFKRYHQLSPRQYRKS